MYAVIRVIMWKWGWGGGNYDYGVVSKSVLIKDFWIFLYNFSITSNNLFAGILHGI